MAPPSRVRRLESWPQSSRQGHSVFKVTPPKRDGLALLYGTQQPRWLCTFPGSLLWVPAPNTHCRAAIPLTGHPCRPPALPTIRIVLVGRMPPLHNTRDRLTSPWRTRRQGLQWPGRRSVGCKSPPLDRQPKPRAHGLGCSGARLRSRPASGADVAVRNGGALGEVGYASEWVHL